MDDPPIQPAHDNQWDAENPSSPKAPDRVSAYAVSESEIYISWRDRSGNEDGFKIFESIEDEHGRHPIILLESDIESYTVLNRQPFTDYIYYIESFNNSGSSIQLPVSASTRHAPPDAPDSLTISNIGQGSITIEWQDNSLIEDYFDLEEAKNIPVNFYPKVTVPTDCTRTIIDSLVSNTLNWYRIASRNSYGVSNYSEAVSVRID